MTKAKNFDEWRAALDALELTMFNCIYADREGNIAYIYNGAVPRRDPSFVWDKPLDGSDPRVEWQGYHTADELPQVINPANGFVQNCNQSPFTTTDDFNPIPNDYPNYMVGESNVDTRRAKMSRLLLRNMKDTTFAEWCKAGFDLTVYWPMEVLPSYKRGLEELKQTDPELAAKVEPYFQHLFDWDYQGGNDSTQATLCWAWYTELYEMKPEGKMQQKYISDPKARFSSILNAVTKLKVLYGDWKVPWGKVARLQRVTEVSVMDDLNFSNKQPSLPCPGMPAEMGMIFNTFYLPPTPLRREMYGLAGHSYVSCIEFGKDKIEAKSILIFGENANPKSKHYFDQAELFSKGEMKPSWFEWDEVVANTAKSYHPGEQ
jgi:acyl-homoserine lactone acylase PvdQ